MLLLPGFIPVKVLVQCKAAQTEAAITGARPMFHSATVFISFQNGLGNEELIGLVTLHKLL